MRKKQLLSNKRLVDIGAMRYPIKIIDREIIPDEVGYTMDFSDYTSLFAAIVTTDGTGMFNGVNIDPAVTHIFYIRYGIVVPEKNYTIEYDSDYYRIVAVENIDMLNRFYKIITIKRGTISLNANWA